MTNDPYSTRYDFDTTTYRKYYNIELSIDGFQFEVARYSLAKERLSFEEMREYETMLIKIYGNDMAEAIKTNRFIVNQVAVAGCFDMIDDADLKYCEDKY